MKPEELRQARLTLGLTAVEFARVFDVNERTLRSWEYGVVKGKPSPIPRPIAVLVRLALKYATVRRELGIASKAIEDAEERIRQAR
jgi:DNA-binding XRE family transcriptional regulator